MIQDWKLTLVVAASPYVGYRVVDEELLRSIVWRGRVRLALFPENAFTQAVELFSSLLACYVSDERIESIRYAPSCFSPKPASAGPVTIFPYLAA